jgi:hypothetical protein
MYENTLTNWSYKKLKMYRACPFSVYLKYVLRVPEPPPNPKYDEKRQRGIRVHEELANAINLGETIPQEARDFEQIVTAYIELDAVAEDDEYFDKAWKRVPGWEGHWLVVKKDVRIIAPGEFVLVADWKTGKKHGNEVDHFEQMKLYAVSEYVQDPGFPEYAVELQYLDQKDTWAHSFKPHELERHWQTFEKDVAVMFADTTFRPKPSIYTCQYCPYNAKNGTGACPVAAR